MDGSDFILEDHRPEQGLPWRRAMAGAQSYPELQRLSYFGHLKTRENHREKEGGFTNSLKCFLGSGRSSEDVHNTSRRSFASYKDQRGSAVKREHKIKEERARRPRRSVVELVPYFNLPTQQRIGGSTAGASQAFRRDSRGDGRMIRATQPHGDANRRA